MPFRLEVDVVPEEGGKISRQYVFYGESEHAAEEEFDAQCGRDSDLAKSREDGRTEESIEEIDEDEWPDYEEVDEK